MSEDADEGAHPWVHVTLDPEDRLRLVEFRRRFLTGCGKRLVERRIDLGKCVDVVEDTVGVEDLVWLTNHDPHCVGLVLATILIEDHWCCRSRICFAGGDALGDPDDDVAHRVAAAEDERLARHGPGVLLRAGGVAFHGERPQRGGLSIERDRPGDGGGGERNSWPERYRSQSNRQPQPVSCRAHRVGSLGLRPWFLRRCPRTLRRPGLEWAD